MKQIRTKFFKEGRGEITECDSSEARQNVAVEMLFVIPLEPGSHNGRFFSFDPLSVVATDRFLSGPFFFGFIIATVGCYFGFSTKGGTQGVGRSTTQAMVAASVLILIVDFFLTQLLIGIFGR